MHNKPKIAVFGIAIESNAFAPISCRQDFEETVFATTPDEGWRVLERYAAFTDRKDKWDIVPLLIAEAEAGGPVGHGFFEDLCQMLKTKIREEGPFDGAIILAHGAGLTTRSPDLDGAYFKIAREAFGETTPIVSFLDLHGNISRDMVQAADILVSMRKNPHTDTAERIEECACLLELLLKGERTFTAWRSAPLVTPQVCQLTEDGQPLGDLLSWALQKAVQEPGVLNVSILPGFAFNDAPYFGFDILITGLEKHTEEINLLADETASLLWSEKDRYQRKLTSVEEAVRLASEACKDDAPPIVLADVADNPGGGARSNTTYLLEALVNSQSSRVFVGLFYDPALVRAASGLRQGERFDAVLNSGEEANFSNQLRCAARLVRFADKTVINKTGIAQEAPHPIGESCLLEIEGRILLGVTSVRRQILSTDFVTHFGVDLDNIRTFVVKSRGHFRAGFEHLVPDERTYEVDCPGLTTANLTMAPFKNIARPIYPLDPILDHAFLKSQPTMD